MLAGLIRQRVKLQEKTVVRGALGETVVWKPIQELYARVIPLDVRAIAQYMQLNTHVTHKVLLRGTVSINLGSHRLLHRDRIYQPQHSAKHYDGVTEVVVLEI